MLDQIIEEAEQNEQYKFYYCYQLDFRGRVYPVGEYLTPQGNKLGRSLLKFAKKGRFQVRWFKLIAVALYKKQQWSEETSIEYFETTVEKIMEKFPEDERWLQAQERWMFASACIEWQEYIKARKKNQGYETGYIGYLDATCSGTQLVSLIMGDEEYAKELNIIESKGNEEAGDFYIKIIEEFKEEIKKQKSERSQEYNKRILSLEDEKLRKIFKRIIMTKNYGVTEYGIRERIEEGFKPYLANLSWEEWKGFKRYVQETFSSFTGGREIFKMVELFPIAAKGILKGGEAIWYNVSRDGFMKRNSSNGLASEEADIVVRQRYLRKEKVKISKTSKQIIKENEGEQEVKKRYKYVRNLFTVNVEMDKIDIRKNAAALGANFIHSVDATWLHGIRMEMGKESPFVGIHDCFGVLLEDIEELNIASRKCLYEMMKDPETMHKLVYGFLDQYKDRVGEEYKHVRNFVAKFLSAEKKKKRVELVKQLLKAKYLLK